MVSIVMQWTPMDWMPIHTMTPSIHRGGAVAAPDVVAQRNRMFPLGRRKGNPFPERGFRPAGGRRTGRRRLLAHGCSPRDNRSYRAAFALRNRPLHHPSGNPHDHHRQRPADRPPPADGGLDHPFLRNFNHRTFHDPDEWFDVPSGRSCPMPSPTRSGRCSDQGVERGRQVR